MKNVTQVSYLQAEVSFPNTDRSITFSVFVGSRFFLLTMANVRNEIATKKNETYRDLLEKVRLDKALYHNGLVAVSYSSLEVYSTLQLQLAFII